MRKFMIGLAVVAIGALFATPAQAVDEREWQLSLTPGVGIPVGDLADDFEDGGLDASAGFAIGAQGHYFLGEDVMENLSVMGSIDFFPMNYGDADFGPFDVDASGSTWGFTGGARYWWFGDRDWTPYADAQLGIYHATAEVDVTGPGVDVSEDDSETAFGFNIGGGVDWEFGENFAAGPFVRYHHAFTDADFQNIEIGIALSYLIGE